MRVGALECCALADLNTISHNLFLSTFFFWLMCYRVGQISPSLMTRIKSSYLDYRTMETLFPVVYPGDVTRVVDNEYGN